MNKRLHIIGATALTLAALGLAWMGQPGPEQKWQFLSAELQPRLDSRAVLIDAGELVTLMHDDYIDLRVIDVRDEHDWNLFHLWGAQRIEPQQLPARHAEFSTLPDNAVIVLVSNDEAAAIHAWKLLMATAQRPNAYILAGGINNWLKTFEHEHSKAAADNFSGAPEKLRYPLEWALGARNPAALPDPDEFALHDLKKKVKLQKRVVRKGGCG